MNVLSFSTVFPSPMRPLFGLFVYERLRYMAAANEIDVVVPIPWLPRLYGGAHLRSESRCGRLTVHYPTFWYLPGALKRFNPALLYYSSLPLVRRLAPSRHYDLIDAHFGWPDGVAACILGATFRLPVVCTLRGSELRWASVGSSRRAMERWLPRCTRIVALSTELARLARSLGVTEDRVQVIENGVDTSRFKPADRNSVRKVLGYEAVGPLVVSVGHLVPGKGFHRLIEAFGIVAERDPNARLAVIGGRSAGTGRYDETLRALVRRLGLETRVVLPGAVDPDIVARWLQACDLFALASEREGSPNVVWEALACGRPVVATDVGDLAGLVPDFAGFVVPRRPEPTILADYLQRAIATPWDWRRIRHFAEGHDWATVSARMQAVWTEALGSSKYGVGPRDG